MKRELLQLGLSCILSSIFIITWVGNLKGYPDSGIHYSLFTHILGWIFCFFALWGTVNFFESLIKLIFNIMRDIAVR